MIDGNKLSVRLKLTDIVGEFEEVVVSKISQIYKDLRYPFTLYLWYDEKEIAPKELKTFMKNWESTLNYKTFIRPNREVKINDGIWYNVTPEGDGIERYRFEYTYPVEWGVLGIVRGLDSFYECAKFCTSPKPPKRKQKRNDYEESGDSRKPEIYQ